MDALNLNRQDFKDLAMEILHRGHILRFQAHGDSMHPFIRNGDLLEVQPIGPQPIRRGDVVLCILESDRVVAHRVIRTMNKDNQEILLIQGDNLMKPDGLVARQNVLGRVVAYERNGKHQELRSAPTMLLSQLWLVFSPWSRLLFQRLAAFKSALRGRLKRFIMILILPVILATIGVTFLLFQAAQAGAVNQDGSVEPSFGAWPAGSLDIPSTPGNDLRVLESDGNGIVLEISAPDFRLTKNSDASQSCQKLAAEGYSESAAPGQPILPVKGVMLGIPPRSTPVLTVLAADYAPLSGSYKLCPQSHPVLNADSSGQLSYGGEDTTPDKQAYSVNQFAPAKPVEMISTSLIRSQAVIQLRIQPFQYNPVTGGLRSIRSLRLKVSWPEKASQPGQRIDEGPFEALLKNVLLNYESARLWRTPPAPMKIGLPALPSSAGEAYKISVNQDGLYQVTYAQLQAEDVPVDSLDPRTFHLFNQGQEVAIQVMGQEDGVFNSSDFILFYGQKTNTRYTDTNVYWLTWGNGNGRRMPTIDGTPGASTPIPDYFKTTLHLEQNRYYQPARPSIPLNDRWYWDFIVASGSAVTNNYGFSLQNLDTSPLSITVRGVLRGFTANPQHHTQVLLNGHKIDDSFWPSEGVHTFEVQAPGSDLQEGANTLSVVLPSDNGITLDEIFVNWFEIDYHRTYAASGNQLIFSGDVAGTWKYQLSPFSTGDMDVFDVTDPFTPSQVLNYSVLSSAGGFTLKFQDTITRKHSYIAQTPALRLSPLSILKDSPSGLHSTTNVSDYIIITHGNFYTDVLPLAAWRQSQGLRVKVVDVQDVYDEFSAGVFNPQAIHDFLAFAYANWQPPAPAFVLLVGDGNYDFKNFLGRGEPNYLPPYLADVDPWVIETDADNRFVAVTGNDILPDMFLGRLPVKTRAETSVMVSKIISYEQNPPGANWTSQSSFVADNADDGGDFAAYSDNVANHLFPPPYTAQKIYYGITHLTPAAAHTAVINAINQGRLIVNYVGHAYLTAWGSENFLKMSDIPGLTNSGRLPFMVPMTCLDGYFIHPSTPSLDNSALGESIVRAAGKGAIASWSATGMSISTGHDFLDRGLFQAIFSDDVRRIGPVTTQAKLFLYANTGDYRDLIDTYVLFGDPAMALNTLPADVSISQSVHPSGVIAPDQSITYVLTYTNAGPATAHHVVISDTLSSEILSPTVTSSGAAITPLAGSNLAWQVTDLAAGQGGVITITAVVASGASLPISNTANITTTAWETNTTDNTAGPVYIAISTGPRLYIPIIFR